LALWQSEFVRAQLLQRFPMLTIELKHVVTQGDRTQALGQPLPAIGGKGLFTAELEECLNRREIDLAVHCLKDLPTELSPEFVLGAIPARAAVEDVVVSRNGCPLRDLPVGATVGTSSPRRSAQILRFRPDLHMVSIRGNVDTRLRKVRTSSEQYDAIVLARAGVQRLGLEAEVSEVLPVSLMLPAPGQGALGIECRAGDTWMLELLGALHDPLTAAAVGAERAFLRTLGAGCSAPVAALAVLEPSGDPAEAAVIRFHGRCLSLDGVQMVEVRGAAPHDAAEELGVALAHEALAQGGRSAP
jgi:hydroxymethylbilane synthase